MIRMLICKDVRGLTRSATFILKFLWPTPLSKHPLGAFNGVRKQLERKSGPGVFEVTEFAMDNPTGFDLLNESNLSVVFEPVKSESLKGAASVRLMLKGT